MKTVLLGCWLLLFLSLYTSIKSCPSASPCRSNVPHSVSRNWIDSSTPSESKSVHSSMFLFLIFKLDVVASSDYHRKLDIDLGNIPGIKKCLD